MRNFRVFTSKRATCSDLVKVRYSSPDRVVSMAWAPPGLPLATSTGIG